MRRQCTVALRHRTMQSSGCSCSISHRWAAALLHRQAGRWVGRVHGWPAGWLGPGTGDGLGDCCRCVAGGRGIHMVSHLQACSGVVKSGPLLEGSCWRRCWCYVRSGYRVACHLLVGAESLVWPAVLPAPPGGAVAVEAAAGKPEQASNPGSNKFARPALTAPVCLPPYYPPLMHGTLPRMRTHVGQPPFLPICCLILLCRCGT